MRDDGLVRSGRRFVSRPARKTRDSHRPFFGITEGADAVFRVMHAAKRIAPLVDALFVKREGVAARVREREADATGIRVALQSDLAEAIIERHGARAAEAELGGADRERVALAALFQKSERGGIEVEEIEVVRCRDLLRGLAPV